MIDSLRGGHFPLLVLELGDFLETNARKAPLVNPFLVETLVRDGVAAVTPGPAEFSQWDSFRGWMAGREIGIVSTNVAEETGAAAQPADRDPRAPVAPSLVVDVEGVRVGLLGVIGEEAFGEIAPAERARFTRRDARQAIEEQLPGLRARADLVVALACVGDQEAETLAREIPELHVVLSGFESLSSARPYLCGPTTIVNRSGSRGQYMGITRLILSPDNRILDWGGRNIALQLTYPEDADLAARVEELTAQLEGRPVGSPAQTESCH